MVEINFLVPSYCEFVRQNVGFLETCHLSGAMTTKGDGGKYPHAVLAHWTLLLLWLVYVSNQWSRYVMEIISA